MCAHVVVVIVIHRFADADSECWPVAITSLLMLEIEILVILIHDHCHSSMPAQASCSQVLLVPLRAEPADPVESPPELARLVDVNLTRTLGGSLCEVLAILECLQSSLEDLALVGQVLCTGKS